MNKFLAFDLDIDGKIKPVFTQLFEIEYGDESELLAHLDSTDKRNAQVRIKTVQFLIKYYCKSFKLSIDTLMEEIRPRVREKPKTE